MGIFLFLLVCCRDGAKVDPGRNATDQKAIVPAEAGFKKYGVKSGFIVFDTRIQTKTVHLEYKTTVYFDNFGIKERRDTYSHDTLTESFLSDGVNNYSIAHRIKEAVYTGAAYRGTEPKFGWDSLSQEDIEAGKVKKLPPQEIAGKVCLVYSINTGIATATYGGWKNIVLLNKIASPGGEISSRAVLVRIVPVNPAIFKIPAGYRYKE